MSFDQNNKYDDNMTIPELIATVMLIIGFFLVIYKIIDKFLD